MTDETATETAAPAAPEENAGSPAPAENAAGPETSSPTESSSWAMTPPADLPIDHPDHPVAKAESFIADIELDAHDDVKEAGSLLSDLVAWIKAHV